MLRRIADGLAPCAHCPLGDCPPLHQTVRQSRTRGGPIKAGWNNTAAAMVQTSESAISLPMLDVPGWLERHRLPKAVAVVMALKTTARVRLDCRSRVFRGFA